MLNKQETPTFEELICHSGESGKLWVELDEYLQNELGLATLIRFPYGKKYGWSVKYNKKSKHICDIFAEAGAFAALFQISTDAVGMICDELDEYAKSIWEDRSPCSGGGWIEFRVLNGEHLKGLKKMINAKVKTRPKKNGG